MKLRPALLVAALAMASCGGGAPDARSPTGSTVPPRGTLTVFAASSLTDAFGHAGDELTRTYPGTRLVFNYGSSSTLATQITNGAPADVFASADETSLQKVIEASLVDGSAAIFATNRLQIVVAPGNPKRIASLADLARRDLVVVVAAPTVPVGRYAIDALGRAGVSLTPASQEVDVRAVLNKVALGEADAGIVYVTDVRSAGTRVTGIEIPEQHQVVARYPIATLKESKNQRLAAVFVDFLLGVAGQRVLGDLGFTPP
ncbi:MAG TPA: molybdate ABC transporter substrate-binding protein [Candidatus Limnocylindria bacterium]|nr:molybdate ABC transporter substrate-binding protein [Candidatus Limnocylindria bacterium]